MVLVPRSDGPAAASWRATTDHRVLFAQTRAHARLERPVLFVQTSRSHSVHLLTRRVQLLACKINPYLSLRRKARDSDPRGLSHEKTERRSLRERPPPPATERVVTVWMWLTFLPLRGLQRVTCPQMPSYEVPSAQVGTPGTDSPRYFALSCVKHVTAESCTGHAWSILSEGRVANLNHDMVNLESGAPQASPAWPDPNALGSRPRCLRSCEKLH